MAGAAGMMPAMGDREERLRGEICFPSDHLPDEVAHMVFVRAPVAHARVVDIDLTAAQLAPGVIAVVDAAELDISPMTGLDGIPSVFDEPPLARGTVRYVGERVVAVLAERLDQAVDAAELVDVRYEPLPIVLDPAHAAQPDAPLLFPDHGSNVALRWDHGDVAEQLAAAAVVITARTHNPRVSPCPLEANAVVAWPTADGVALRLGTQMPSSTRDAIAAGLGLAPSAVHVEAPPMGGAFGGKTQGGHPDVAVTAALALRVGRAVRFVETRSENLVAMAARDHHHEVELAAAADGTLLALRLRATCDAGAYPTIGAIEPGKTMLLASGPYRIPAVEFHGISVATNKAPAGPYRGPGRAEAAAVLERTMDRLAAALDLDPVTIRRHNLLTAAELPHTSPTGATYDSGDHHRTLDRALELADHRATIIERDRRRHAGETPLIGVGVSTYVDSTSWFRPGQSAGLCVRADGRVELVTDAADAGQGQDRAFVEVVRRVLPLPASTFVARAADGEAIGSFGSRSIQLSGPAISTAAAELADRLRDLAAERFEAAPGDITIDAAGRFGVAGVPRSAVTLAELVAGTDPLPSATAHHDQAAPTFPHGCHVSVVEVDPDTGLVRLIRHVAVTDCGTVVDRVGAAGQVVGASVQGIAQALYEEVTFDATGTPERTNLATYAVPSAAELPWIETAFAESPTPLNELGAKGVGEAGTVGAPPAVQNAVVDALAHLGVDHVEMPCTPERVWQAIRSPARSA